MLKRTYKSLYEKIEPPDNLIALTKEKMKKEKLKKHFSLYKYGTIAACFIIAIVITIPYTTEKSENTAMQSTNNAMDTLTSPSIGNVYEDYSSIDSFSGSAPSFEMQEGNFKGNSFVTMDSANSAEIQESNSMWEKIINFIKTILSLPLKLIQSIIDFFTF